MVRRKVNRFETTAGEKTKPLKLLRKLIITVLAWSLYYSGLLFVIVKAIRRLVKPKAIILYYHHVSNYQNGKGILKLPFELGVTLNLFEKQMKLLARSYNVISLQNLISDLCNNKKIDFNTVSICFDDGYLDNYVYAFPVLRRYSLPATIFVPSDFVGTNERLWYDRLASLLKYLVQNELPSTGLRDEQLPEAVKSSLMRLVGAPLNQVGEGIECVVRRVKEMHVDKIAQTLAILEALGGESKIGDDESSKLMSWEQLKEMSLEGVTVGGHTVSHPQLTQLGDDEAFAELVNSKNEIEARLNMEICLFAYPSGDYDLRIKEMVKEVGFLGAFTTVPGWVDGATDLHEICRVGIDEETFKNVFGRFSRSIFHVKMCQLFAGKTFR